MMKTGKTKLAVCGLLSTAMISQAVPTTPVSLEDMQYLNEIMRETWHYIDYFVSPKTGLPYDSNIAEGLTNTTNIGLYLASVCMAYKLEYITKEHALERITRILDSLDKFEHWNRLYTNLLDADGNEFEARPGQSNISDYNKLPAGVITVRQTFPELADRCTAFLNEIPWKAFADANSHKTCYAFDVAARETSEPVHYFRGEDKLLGLFLMVASEQVSPTTWLHQDQSVEEKYGYEYYLYGWQGGGLFMHFICSLFLDNRGTDIGKSAANFAWAQILHANKLNAPVWGWSACVAPNGIYYGMGRINDAVVTPHASALAISLFPRQVIANLRLLDQYGLRKPCIINGQPEYFGYRDSVNWKTGQISDKYLILDQAMLFLSLANFCQDGLLWKTFNADPLVQNGKQLIEEYAQAPQKVQAEQAYIHALSTNEIGTFWLTERLKDESITCSLYGRSLSNNESTNSAVRWKVTDHTGQILHAGLSDNPLNPGETHRVITLNIPTDSAIPGHNWKLESTTSHDGKKVSSFSKPIRFNTYKDIAGTWRVKTGDSPDRAGTDINDHAWQPIQVPHCWENDGLGGYDGIAWYRLHITITPEQFALWKDRPLAVALGFIDDADETYLNGIQIGKTGSIAPAEESGYMTPRLYPFDHALLQTNNVLAVRVSDWGGSGGIWHGPIAIGPRSELEDVIEEMK